MTASTEDMDHFRNGLAETLGAETLTKLSAAEPERPFLGWEVVAGYGVYLLTIFAAAFLKELQKRIEDEVTAAAKKVANAFVDALKAAAGKIKPVRPSSVEDQRQIVAETDTALREVAAFPEVKAAIDAAKAAGKEKIVAELKSIGFSDQAAEDKAEQLVKKIVARIQP